MSPPAMKAEAPARGAKSAEAVAGGAEKGKGKRDAEDAFGLDAIVAAAADELRSSSGSALGSQERDESDEDRKKPSARGVGKSKDAPAVAASGRSSKAEGPGGTRKSAREAGGNAKADGKTSAKSSKEPKSEAAAAAARPKGAKGGAKKEADAPAAADADADASAKPKLPRPEGVAPCPRCHSEETKFCYYNNYNVKQPRYFCRGCQRYWTAGGMLRNVPVGAGRRKNKNGIANGAGEDEDASIAAGRILAGVAGAANPLHQLAPLAAAASAARRDRRGGSSDGSATEADGDVNAASGANPALSAQWPMAAAAAQQAGMMNHFATAAAGAFGNPFAAMQAAAMQQATGGYNPDALQGVVAAQMAMFAHAQAQAQGGAGQEAAAAAAQAQARAFAVAQQGVFANAAAAAAAAAQSQRATPNPFAAAAHAFGAAAAGSPSTSSAANGGPIKPTASGGFAALPPHLQRQLSGAESLPGSPRAGASATNAAAPAHSAAAAPADAAAAAATLHAGAGSPNLSAMMMMMGPAMAAMQQQHAAQQRQQQPPNAAAAAAAAAAAGLNPQQMQQVIAAMTQQHAAAGGFSPFASASAPPTTTAATAAAPSNDGSPEAAAEAGDGKFRENADGSKRFKVSEDRAGHAG